MNAQPQHAYCNRRYFFISGTVLVAHQTIPNFNPLAASVNTLRPAHSAGGGRAFCASAAARATAGATLPTDMPLPSVVFRRPCDDDTQHIHAAATCLMQHEATQETWCEHRRYRRRNSARS